MGAGSEVAVQPSAGTTEQKNSGKVMASVRLLKTTVGRFLPVVAGLEWAVLKLA